MVNRDTSVVDHFQWNWMLYILEDGEGHRRGDTTADHIAIDFSARRA